MIPLPLEFYFIAVPLEKIYVVGSNVGDFGDGSKSCFWHQASTPHRHFWGLGTFQLKFRQPTVYIEWTDINVSRESRSFSGLSNFSNLDCKLGINIKCVGIANSQ